MICPYCKGVNPDDNIVCNHCGRYLTPLTQNNDVNNLMNDLAHEEYNQSNFNENRNFERDNANYVGILLKHLKVGDKKKAVILNIILCILFLPMFLIGVFLLHTSLSVDNKIKTYEKVEGTLVEYVNCEEDLCEGVYEYNIFDSTYKITSPFSDTKENLKQTEEIYYKPSNPSEAEILGDTSYGMAIILMGGSLLAALIFSSKVKAQLNS